MFSLLAIGLAFAPSSLQGSVAKITLKELVNASDLIVLASELKIEDGPDDLNLGEEMPPIKIATASVLEVWKGSAGHEVRYVASPTWRCDISEANVGERVVLFLLKPNGWPLHAIAHAGRGRMPIRDVEGKSYVTIWAEDVRLPKGVMTIPGPDPKYEFIRSVDLNGLRSTVTAMGRTEILIIGSVATFALAGLTWLFSSRHRRHIQTPISPGETWTLDGRLPRDAGFRPWLVRHRQGRVPPGHASRVRVTVDLRLSHRWDGPHSLDPIGVKQEIYREDAKRAKKVGEPAHNPLTVRFMPSLTEGRSSSATALRESEALPEPTCSRARSLPWS